MAEFNSLHITMIKILCLCYETHVFEHRILTCLFWKVIKTQV